MLVTLKKFYDAETGLWNYSAETDEGKELVNTLVNFADYNYNHILNMPLDDQVKAITKTMGEFDYVFMSVIKKAAMSTKSYPIGVDVKWDDGTWGWQRDADAHRILMLLHQAGPNSIFTNLLNIEKNFI